MSLQSMHDSVNVGPFTGDVHVPAFETVCVTHAVQPESQIGTRAYSAEMLEGQSSFSAIMVTAVLRDGTNVTVWGDGTVQLGNADGTFTNIHLGKTR
jgi:hypothetical protein